MPSIPQRMDALEAKVDLAQARRLALLTAIHAWLTSDPNAQTPDAFNAFKDHLEERLAEEGP